MPFADFGLVDNDDVGQLGQRQQVMGFGSGRRRVDHDDCARCPTHPGRRDGRGDRYLQLQQHHVAVGDDGLNVGGRDAEVGVRARRDHDGVLGGGVDHDDRRAAGPGHDRHTVQSNVVGPQVRPQSLGRRVVTERRDEFDRGAARAAATA